MPLVAVSQKVIESLEQQELCPVCGVNWAVIEDSLNEGIKTKVCRDSIKTIRKCDICIIRFFQEINSLILYLRRN